MDAELKKKWVQDLRDNPELQGIYLLNDDGKYCCLGRLCELANIPSKPHADILNRLGYGVTYYAFGFPTRDTLKKLGISYTNADKLAEMNDDGYTFAQIADYIESNSEI